MPRLPVWFALGSTLSSSFYAFYYHYHLPRQTVDKENAALLSTEKLGIQRVMQQLTLLKALPVPQTNKERERLYVAIHRAKLELARCEKGVSGRVAKGELLAIWAELCDIERQWCTALAFRATPLSAEERFYSVLSWSIYVGFFCLVVPIARFLMDSFFEARAFPKSDECDVAEAMLVVAQHRVARWLLGRMMNVTVVTRVAPTKKRSQLPRDAEEGSMRDVVVLCYSPTSWIDELAFFASPENPLVAQSLAVAEELEERSRNKAQAQSGMPSLNVDGDTSTRYVLFKTNWTDARARGKSFSSVSAHAFMQSLSKLAKDEETRREAVDDAKKALTGVTPTLGYPVAQTSLPSLDQLAASGKQSGAAEVGGDEDTNTAVTIVPLVSRGLPSAIYVSEAVARPDQRVGKSESKQFDDVMRLQYKKRPAESPSSSSDEQAKPIPNVLVKSPCALPLMAPASIYGACGGTIELFVGEPSTVLSGFEVLEANLSAYNALYAS